MRLVRLIESVRIDIAEANKLHRGMRADILQIREAHAVHTHAGYLKFAIQILASHERWEGDGSGGERGVLQKGTTRGCGHGAATTHAASHELHTVEQALWIKAPRAMLL
jgi:hypothetical protein